MNAENYVIAAYVIGLGLMWGYAVYLWNATRRRAGGGQS